jgi:CheY-like chemotaxis protein
MASEQRQKLLLVGDSGFFRRALAEILEQEGFEVLMAGDGQEAYRVSQTERPALIILDMLMPKLDGMMVLRLLRANHLTRSIPVLVFSGHEQERDVREAMRLGAAAYCSKAALDFATLITMIQRFTLPHPA